VGAARVFSFLFLTPPLPPPPPPPLLGQNAAEFALKLNPILPTIVIPQAFPALTSRRVLTAEWVAGEKLAESKADDVGDLVDLGVIAYLSQLLDIGLFHADPHAGNMIRTPDGRLAIIDFGMVSRLAPGTGDAILDAIIRLIRRDYRGLLDSFVELGFLDANDADVEKFLPPLSRVFDAALAGGGAAGINFEALSADLAQITFDLPFRIPPYFALVIRAITVLEGIALIGDPSFAIIASCYPYIARRLLADPSPRSRESLRYLVYGQGGTFDARSLLSLLEAFESHQATTAAAARAGGEALPSRVRAAAAAERAAAAGGAPEWLTRSLALLDPFGLTQRASAAAATAPAPLGSRAALAFLLSPDGAFFRAFLIEEVARSIDGLSRAQAAALVERLGLDAVSLPAPPGAARRWVPLSPELTDADLRAVDNVAVVLEFLLAGRARGGARGAAALAADVAPLLPAVATEVVPALLARLTSRVVARGLRDLFLEGGPGSGRGRAALPA